VNHSLEIACFLIEPLPSNKQLLMLNYSVMLQYYKTCCAIYFLCRLLDSSTWSHLPTDLDAARRSDYEEDLADAVARLKA
jgi:hypothetical protein